MRSQSRAGFTLIELMVALALTMFLLVIMTECFVLSIDTFTGLKAIGDMQQNLRTACTLLQADLAEDHFEGKRRLSDPNIFNAQFPIQAGYVAIKQSSAVVPIPKAPPLPHHIYEGADAFGVQSFSAVDQVLGFTVKRKGNRPEAFFTTALHDNLTGGLALQNFFYPAFPNNTKSTAYGMLSAPNSPLVGGSLPGFPPPVIPKIYTPPGSFTVSTPDLPSATYTMPYTGGNLGFYSSQWAEVYYYLVRTGSTEEPNNPLSVLGTPTYSLYRAQFIMVPDSTNLVGKITAGNLATFQGISCNVDPGGSGFLLFNSPTDAAYNAPTFKNKRRAIDLITGTTQFPVTPLNFGLADLRLVPAFAPYNGAGTGRSEAASGAQTQGSIEVVLPNVVSFNVQVLDTLVNVLAFNDLVPGAAAYFDSTAYNNANVGFNAQNANPAYPAASGYAIRGIRVTVRVWDNKTRQTRQASIVQDL